MIPHPREVNASKQNKCIHVTTGSNQNHINMEVKDTKSRSIRLLLYVGHCGVVAAWTTSGCLQCLLGEDVSCLGNFKVGVFRLLPELLTLEPGTWKLVTTLPAQLGNLGALPTYTACISCGLATWQPGCLAYLHCLCTLPTWQLGCLACLHCLLGAPR